MTEISKLVSLASAGVPTNRAIELSGFNRMSKSDGAVLVNDVIKLGVPISQVGQRLIEFELDMVRFESEIQQSRAVPIATRNLMLWLPAISLVISQLAGFQTFSALLHPVGIAATIFAAGLVGIGVSWSGKFLAPLRTPKSHPALDLMRLQLIMQSGMPLRNLDQSLSTQANDLIELSKTTGARLSLLIESEIATVSTLALQQSMLQAKELAIKLLIPMGATVLPAFLILTIVPMFIGIGF